MAEPPISRGFKSRRAEQTPKDRLPPGQYDDRLSGSFGRAHASNQGGKLDFCPAVGRIPASEMELDGVRGAPSNHGQDRHSLRHQMAEAGYHLARRDVRRSVESSGSDKYFGS